MHRVAIVGGARTPFVKALTHFKELPAVTLASHAVNGALAKLDLSPEQVEELHLGVTVVNPRVPHLARETVFRSGLGAHTRAITYTDNCIGGTTAMVGLYDAIAMGRVSAGIAAGVESMSNTTIMFSENASAALRNASAERSGMGKLRQFLAIGPKDLAPSLPGVEEPSTGMSMGQHCELMVKEWKIQREPQDELAFHSHERAAAATADGRLTAEIHPLAGIDKDTIVRGNTSIEKLAKLKPVFDKAEGTLTAGNSSPLTDGAAAVVLMSASRARKEDREILAYIKDFVNVGIEPEEGLLMGPGVAVPRLLKKHGLTLEDIDLIEIHEAFAGQVLCNIAAWEQGWKEEAIGTVDHDKLNVRGGSIAIGHPFAATGARILLSLADEMSKRNARYGLISICAAGAQAAAVLLERKV